MIGTLLSTVTAAARSILRLWNRIPLRVQGRITVCLPLLAVCVSAGLAFTGNLQRVDIETDIQRKFEMSGALGDLTTLMVSAETGMRGYLLTGRSEFLQPFDRATAELPDAITRLRALASAEPGEKPRADKLARVQDLDDLTGRQLADLSFQRGYVSTAGRSVSDPTVLEHLAYGKGLMDQIRGDVDSMRAEERGLLDDRIAEINAIRVRDYVSVALALVVAAGTRLLAWYLFKRGTMRRVERLTESVRRIRRGHPLPSAPEGKRDELGVLESEIHLLRT